MDELHTINLQRTIFAFSSSGLREVKNESSAAELAEKFPTLIYFVADVVEPERQVMFYNDSYGDVYAIIGEEFAQKFAEDHDFGIFLFAEVYDVV